MFHLTVCLEKGQEKYDLFGLISLKWIWKHNYAAMLLSKPQEFLEQYFCTNKSKLDIFGFNLHYHM